MTAEREYTKQALEASIRELESALEDRKKALPAHSVQPQHLLAIEELEEKIEEKQKMLDALENASGKN